MTLEEVVAAALAEDLGAGLAGDVTSATTVPAEARGGPALVARQDGVVAGVDAARAVFAAVDARTVFEAHHDDGDAVAAGATVATVEGPARSLLAAERTALNLLGHLSGVATATRSYVERLAGTGCAVRDTRKTLPGLRGLQKAAVVAGGGVNHRFGLHDGVLIKDNHVAAAGGVAAATKAALAGAGNLPVQVEVDDLEQLEEALAAGAPAVLLDNFAIAELWAAVARCRRHPARVFVEASGRVTLDTVADIGRTGVDAVAVGALTHSAPSLDVAMDWRGPTRMDWRGPTRMDWRGPTRMDWRGPMGMDRS